MPVRDSRGGSMTTPQKNHENRALELMEQCDEFEIGHYRRRELIAMAQVHATLHTAEELSTVAAHLATVIFHMGER